MSESSAETAANALYGPSENRVRVCLDRIAARESSVRAWAHVDGEGALAAARLCDARPQDGTLQGIPVGVKDVFDTVDQPTTYGFAPYEGFRPEADSNIVARLRLLGMIVLGKTATTEFASPSPETAPTRNPLDLDRSPGFSSSGSAAAVADDMVPLAIGTQTGASVIRPAAHCGIFGYKPSLHAIDPAGIRHAKPSIDTIGLFAKTLENLSAFAHGLGLGARPRFDEAPRIGVCRTRHWDRCSNAMKAALIDAEAILKQGGATVKEVILPASLDAFDPTFDTVMAYEHAASLALEYERWPNKLHPWNVEQVVRGRRISASVYRASQGTAARFRADFARLFDEFDLIVTPSAEDEAPLASEVAAEPWFRDWTFLHGPCLSLPFGRGAHGLPLGVQLVGRSGDDASFLAAARWVNTRLSQDQ